LLTYLIGCVYMW